MADLTTSTKINESTRDVTYAFQYQYVDGGNESAVSKIDVSGLAKSANGDTCSGLRIVEVWWIVKNMTVEVLADASTDIIIMHIDENNGYQDFTSFGGLPDTSDYGSSGTGDVKFTTTGAGAAGDSYQVVIRGIKQY
jgi:hypothetical protein